jgi:glycosyltransferase involved in cell wall biosynthesis
MTRKFPSTLIVTPTLRGGGAERCLVVISEALLRQGTDLELLCLSSDRDYELSSALARRTTHLVDRSLNRLDNIRSLRRIGWAQTLEQLLENKAHVISNQWIADILVGQTLPSTMRPHREAPTWTVGVQTDVMHDIGNGLRGGIRLRALKRYSDFITKVVACSPGMVGQARRYVGVDRTLIHVAPNPVDCGSVPVPDSSTASEGPLRILSAGRFVDQKGLEMVVATARVLSQGATRFTWDIMGGGPDEQRLLNLIHQSGMSEHIALRDFTPDLPAAMQSYDVFVSTSKWEPFGNVMAEALVAGLPVIATSTDGSRFLGDLLPVCVTLVERSPSQMANALRASDSFPDRRSISLDAREVLCADAVSARWFST